jgi:hypothetical protein
MRIIKIKLVKHANLIHLPLQQAVYSIESLVANPSQSIRSCRLVANNVYDTKKITIRKLNCGGEDDFLGAFAVASLCIIFSGPRIVNLPRHLRSVKFKLVNIN